MFDFHYNFKIEFKRKIIIFIFNIRCFTSTQRLSVKIEMVASHLIRLTLAEVSSNHKIQER